MTVSADGLPQRVAQKWFVEALRWYIEEHQGCPRCRGHHCVFRAQWGNRTEYHCTACDFSAAHDQGNGIFAATDGEVVPPAEVLVVEPATTMTRHG
jgi:hypothetical protein